MLYEYAVRNVKSASCDQSKLGNLDGPAMIATRLCYLTPRGCHNIQSFQAQDCFMFQKPQHVMQQKRRPSEQALIQYYALYDENCVVFLCLVFIYFFLLINHIA